MRDAPAFRQEAVADKPIVPVVRVAYLYFVFSFAQGGRYIHLPWSAPRNATIHAVDKNMRETGRNIAEGEGDSVRVRE